MDNLVINFNISFVYLLLVSLGLLLIGYLVSQIRYWRIQKELNAILLLIKSNNSAKTSKITFSNKTTKRIANNIILLKGQKSEQNSADSLYEEMISLSHNIAEASNDTELTAEQIAEVISHSGPEIAAIAIVLRNSQSKKLEVAHSIGLPPKRIDSILIEQIETAIENKSSQWKHINADNRLTFSYRALGIGTTYISQLSSPEGMMGAIWLGFKEGCSGLNPQRKLFIEGICRHAEASFYAARCAKEREQVTENQRDFLIGMSHDLRAPGNTALYCVRSLLEGYKGSLNNEQQIDLNIIERSLIDQQEIIRDVLDITRYKHGLLEPISKDISLKEHFNPIYKSFSRSADEKNLKLLCNPIPNIGVNFDPKHLKRIFSNLLSNAIKYTDEGEISISFREDNQYLIIDICDSGIGIPINVTEKELFGEFQRLKNAKGRQGTGLGLAICKALVALNNGSLTFRRNKNRGTTFSLSIPIATNYTYHKNLEQEPINNFGKKRVLVLDDDAPTRGLMSKYLRGYGLEPTEIESLDEAENELMFNHYELLVTDYNLKDEVCIPLLEKYSTDMQIIVCSGATNLALRDPLFQSDNIQILEKPVDRKTLYSSLNNANVENGRML